MFQKACALFIFLGFVNAQNCIQVSAFDSQTNSSNLTIDCNYNTQAGGCIVLNSQFTDIRSTSSYAVSSIPYAPVASFTAGTVVNISQDDRFSELQQIGFPFCFFQNAYNQLVIGDNGVISFDPMLAGLTCPHIIGGSIPNVNLLRNAIFGVYHDLTNDPNSITCVNDPSTPENECGEIRMLVLGQAPCRIFVVNYYNMLHFGCTDERSTTQIVLYESSQIIEVYVQVKPETCFFGQEKRSLIGIHNSNGTAGVAPPGRNTGIWTAQQEAWRFTPTGPSVVNLRWLDSNGVVVGAGPSVTVCPTASTTYTLEANYQFCQGNNLTRTSTVTINFASDYPVPNVINAQICDVGNDNSEIVNLLNYSQELIGNQVGTTLTFFNTESNAQTNVNPITNPESFLLNVPQTTVFVREQIGSNCFTISQIRFTLTNIPSAQITQTSICDDLNDGVENVVLSTLNSQIIGNQSGVNISYHTTLFDAENNLNPINNFSASQGSQVFIRLSRGTCFSVTPFTFNLAPGGTTTNYNLTICDNYSLGYEIVDITQYQGLFTGGQNYSNIRYFTSFPNAQANINPIADPQFHQLLVTNPQVFIRLLDVNGCISYAILNFNFLDTPNLNNLVKFKCDEDNDGVEFFNLESYLNEITGGSLNLPYTFYQNFNNTIQMPLNPISNSTNYPVSGINNLIFVVFTNSSTGCTHLSTLNLNVIAPPIATVDEIEVCDVGTDGVEMINLTAYLGTIIGGQPAIQGTFHATQSDALNNINPITSYELTSPSTVLYVRLFTEDDGCPRVYPITFILLTSNNLNPQDISIIRCNNINDSTEIIDLTELTPLINPGAQGVVVSFYFNNNDGVLEGLISNPSQAIIPTNITRIFARTDNICFYEISEVNITFIPAPQLNNHSISVCDENSSGNEVIDLTQFNGFFTNDPQIQLHYFTSMNDAIGFNNFITNPNAHIVNLGNNRIYVRGTSIITGCYNISFFDVNVVSLPVLPTTGIPICDIGNDQQEFVILSSLDQLVSNSSTAVVYYYETLVDASQDVNRIAEYNLTPNTQLFVRISPSPGLNCLTIGGITFDFRYHHALTSTSVIICDNNADNRERVNLNNFSEQISGGYQDLTLNFYTNQNDAASNQNPISNPNQYLLNQTQNTIYVRSTQTNGCFDITTLNIQLANAIFANNTIYNTCDNNSDLSEFVNLYNLVPNMISSTSGLEVSFYELEEAAETEDANHLISNPSNLELIAPQTFIFVRFENPATGCYTVRKIEANLIPLPKLIVNFSTVCNNLVVGEFQTNLLDIRQIVIGDFENYTFTFFNSFVDAQNQTNPITNPQQYIVPSFPHNIFALVENQFGCRSITRVTLTPGPVTQVNNTTFNQSVCDINNDGSEVVDLTNYISQMTNVSNPVYSFYPSLEEARQEINQINDPSAFTATTTSVFVRFKETGKCDNIVRLNLTLRPVPVLENVVLSICEQPFDGIASFNLNSSIEQINNSPGLQYAFYTTLNDAQNQLNPISNPLNYTNVSNPQVIYAVATNSFGCSNIAEVTLHVNETPAVFSSTLYQCDNNSDGIASFNLDNAHILITSMTNANITFYTSLNNLISQSNPITNTSNFTNTSNPQTLYVLVKNPNGSCSAQTTLQLVVNNTRFQIPDIRECEIENTSTANFNLTLQQNNIQSLFPNQNITITYFLNIEDASTSTNPILNPQSFNSQTIPIVARVDTEGNSCIALVEFTAEVLERPEINIPDDTFCLGEIRTLTPGTGFIQYLWSTNATTPTENFSQSGEYWVEVVGQNGCRSLRDTFILEFIPPPVITHVDVNQGSAFISATGQQAPFYYSIDGENWSTSPYFTGLQPGTYTALVKNSLGCISVEFFFGVIEIYNIITPGTYDGVNDEWRIVGLEAYPDALVSVYDRYGKLVFQKSTGSGISWNGVYNGRNLPSGTYWYVINIPDGRKLSGWVVLKNRNTDY